MAKERKKPKEAVETVQRDEDSEPPSEDGAAPYDDFWPSEQGGEG